MLSAPKTYTPRLLPLRLPRVCVAVAASDSAELLEKAETLIRDNPFIELRLDYLSKPALALPKVKQFMESHAGITVIATCRRAASSGVPSPPSLKFSAKPPLPDANWSMSNSKPRKSPNLLRFRNFATVPA
jgi:hypothetical protein